MEKIILIKNGELALKGLNRNTFEDILCKNIRHALKDIGEFSVSKSQSTIMVRPENEVDFSLCEERIKRVFGIAAYSVCAVCKKDIECVKGTVKAFLGDELSQKKTFKVKAKRSDKRFELTSPQICDEIGGFVLSSFKNLRVDVHNPEITVCVEVRDQSIFVHSEQKKGAGGMPVGTSGRIMALLSGGIDSPVCMYMMAKRGAVLDAVHFAAPPYTSQRAEMKVRSLASIVAKSAGRINFAVVPFTKIQEAIRDNYPEELFTIIMRRQMMKIAGILAKRTGAKAICTGESLGQVASQTLDAMVCTDSAVDMPIFRPLIGMDKEEIIEKARKIGTFETSLLPYEDCCTVFTPPHPKTRPDLNQIKEVESSFDLTELINEAVLNTHFKGVY